MRLCRHESKPYLAAVFCLFIQTTSVLAGAIPEQRPRLWEPELPDPLNLLPNLVRSLADEIPTVSTFGQYLFDTLLNLFSGQQYTVTQNARSPLIRWTNLKLVRTNFWYGPPVAGGPAYPEGALGTAKVVHDFVDIQLELRQQLENAMEDLTKAVGDYLTGKFNDLETLDDYMSLYDDEWLLANPSGLDPGVATNYTQDLFFSMQRLSNSPYQIRRLNPAAEPDSLQFAVDDETVRTLTGTNLTLPDLHQEGRLFYADYRDQGKFTQTEGRHAAACDAFFYIHPQSGDFLPLAIRTNAGANLIYTPLDSPGDWLLAKMMYGINDFWFAQWNHLAATHEVVHIIWMAAIRTFSLEHPIHAILHRLMFQVFSIQLLAKFVLFSPFGAVDQIFAFSGPAAQEYTTTMYKNSAGHFQANYFLRDLRTRGLIESIGPSLKSFPFLEDASAIHDSIHQFMTSFVQSFYSSDADVLADREIQDWVTECHGPANVLDFPEKIDSVDTLIEVLTQLTHLVSTAHHTTNTNELMQISSVLPYSPPAFYKPLPVSKSNTTNPAEYLPPFKKTLEQTIVAALFARPLLIGTNRTIVHMFDDDSMLERMNAQTREANSVFMEQMRNFSSQVQERTFDSQGLSQGMPFVWKALDPNVIPYSIST
ncbi:lipoxygenase [Rhypophila decipiens]|uniref:Manganese lipoxygenase n=1 Tax=Rhypophila decipiens TaxID=261697 RepID=A0AAN6Y6G4_9PEZI|nr:lipoxygenase [Rhypophila decipiens]